MFESIFPHKVIVGLDVFDRIGEITESFGGRALVVTNTDTPGSGGLSDRLGDILAEHEIDTAFYHQVGEPHISNVETAYEMAQDHETDVLIGIGGGSAMDTAKATAALLTNGGQPLDYMEVIGKGQKLTKHAAPWIAVPTTAGTGAEVTKNAVLADPDKGFKASLRSDGLMSRVALVDGRLGIGLPPDVTASTGMDALCQLIESYTSTGANPITDALACDGIRRAAVALPRSFHVGDDIDARQDMALAAMLSGLTLTNAGLGAVHGFSAPLGANIPVPHGIACAALLPDVMRANVEALKIESVEHPTLRRYAEIGRLMTAEPTLTDMAAIEEGLEFTHELLVRLSIPKLKEFGLTDAAIPELATLARKASSMQYNPVTLSDKALQEILKKQMSSQY